MFRLMEYITGITQETPSGTSNADRRINDRRHGNYLESFTKF